MFSIHQLSDAALRQVLLAKSNFCRKYYACLLKVKFGMAALCDAVQDCVDRLKGSWPQIIEGFIGIVDIAKYKRYL